MPQLSRLDRLRAAQRARLRKRADKVAGSASQDEAAGELTACASKLKGLADVTEDQVVLAANPDVPYQAIVHTMNALRQSDGRDLFPDVRFAVPR